MKLRVMIVDDHRIFRRALAQTLADDPDIEVVAEAGDGIEALARAADCLPDVVCMDISMPRLNGIETTRLLLQAQPQIKVIGLSAFVEQRLVQDMLAAGAVGYVNKAEAAVELLAALKAVGQGGKFLGSALNNALLEQQRSGKSG